MPEPRPGPPPEDARQPPPETVSAGPLDLFPDDLAPLDAEPTDDSPTIVSKNVPRPPATPEEALLGNLRGRHLAHFELLEPIGVGGMAAVLRARDTQLDRFVALKILPPDMAQDAENVRRFHQEARSAAKLDHENIARVFFCGEDRRLHFIAFEFVEGENLRTILERRGRLPAGEALHYVLQVAAGLAHASRRGVVHRDIKPSNIIITPNGRAKLVDMGLARSLEPQNDRGLTQSGVTLGTFDYISPEQALEPRDADVRSDIYSLGCTLYHMITGHAPVPEGTAAKKLHHHQHIPPPDPRQFVPDLPDEVAVVLDRMMAKQPKDRYQSPDQLVHHLLLVARKLGAAPEVPEGVLSVEAALPSPPGGRPLLLTALAALAVIGLVLALGQSTPSPAPAGPRPKVADRDTKPDREPLPAKSIVPVKPPDGRGKVQDPPKPDPKVAKYETDTASEPQQLAEWLQNHKDADRIEIVLGGDLDVSKLKNPGEPGTPGLFVKAPKVIIRAKEGLRDKPVIRLGYNSEIQKDLWAALTIESEQATVEGVRFLVDGTDFPVELAGLRLRGGRHHKVSECEFLQVQVQVQPYDQAKNRIASLVIEETSSCPAVELSGCCFAGSGRVKNTEVGGQDAVVCDGPANLRAVSCAFGPHAAVFHLRNRDGVKTLETVVRHCSVLAAGPEAVFLLSPRTTAALTVESSLLACSGERSADGPNDPSAAVLIRQVQVEGGVTYTGQDNRYYLDGYWAREGATADWKSFQDRSKDKGLFSRELKASPWQDPRPLVSLAARQFAAAFHPDPGTDALRLSGQLAHLVGVERLGTKDYLADLPKKDLKPERRLLVVEKDKNDSSHGIYSTLGGAILAAQPGDTILLKHTGELQIDPVDLKKPTIDLTIQPERGYRPVLTLANPGDGEPDVAMFSLLNGKLRLKRLQFVLKPGDTRYTAQALVALAANGQCVLENCVVTLDRGAQDTRLALATVREPAKGMMKPDTPPARSPGQGPRLELQGCLVRGDGDLMWARAGRPFELAATGTMVVLSGSLLNVEAAWDATAPSRGKVNVTLDHVTTYLSGYLLRLAGGKEGKGGKDLLAPVKCEASYCLFGAPGAERVLIHFDGPEAGDPTLKERLQWVGKQNAYGAFRYILEQHDGTSMPVQKNVERWKSFLSDSDSSSDDGGKYGVTAPFASPPAADTFPQARPADLRPTENLDGYGADPTKVPPPTAPTAPEPK